MKFGSRCGYYPSSPRGPHPLCMSPASGALFFLPSQTAIFLVPPTLLASNSCSVWTTFCYLFSLLQEEVEGQRKVGNLQVSAECQHYCRLFCNIGRQKKELAILEVKKQKLVIFLAPFCCCCVWGFFSTYTGSIISWGNKWRLVPCHNLTNRGKCSWLMNLCIMCR